ncbi:MAG: DUF721 domain-containing protein [Methylocystis sp.]|uniref:DUF721 domain-containing protein n=1 Tax=Methylocystis sp. TaxID=1911079 RepID=UPI003DA26955
MSVAPRGKGRIGRPLAEIVLKQLDPLVARQGFGEASLLLRWPEIVGARVAGVCAPERLQWPARARNAPPDRAREPATLILRVEPGFGLEVQHMAPAILERVNAHLGWRCVARLTLRQQALAAAPGPSPPRRAPTDPAARARAQSATDGVEDAALRAALIRLGERALARR